MVYSLLIHFLQLHTRAHILMNKNKIVVLLTANVVLSTPDNPRASTTSYYRSICLWRGPSFKTKCWNTVTCFQLLHFFQAPFNLFSVWDVLQTKACVYLSDLWVWDQFYPASNTEAFLSIIVLFCLYQKESIRTDKNGSWGDKQLCTLRSCSLSGSWPFAVILFAVLWTPQSHKWMFSSVK